MGGTTMVAFRSVALARTETPGLDVTLALTHAAGGRTNGKPGDAEVGGLLSVEDGMGVGTGSGSWCRSHRM